MSFTHRSDNSVLVIGNGPTVLDKLSLEIISKYDVIVRINRGYFEGIEKHKEVIGTQTDYLYIHDGFCTNEWFTTRSVDFASTTLFLVVPNFKYSHGEALQMNNKWIHLIPRQVEDDIKERYNFDSRWPTTGLECLLHLSTYFEDITIVGFDNNTKEGFKHTNYHFYKHTDNRTMKDMQNKNRPDHKFLLERQIVDDMIAKEIIKVL